MPWHLGLNIIHRKWGMGSAKEMGRPRTGRPMGNICDEGKLGRRYRPPNSSIFRLTESEAGITHGVNDSQAGQFVTGLTQLSTSHLEALLNAHANAAHRAA